MTETAARSLPAVHAVLREPALAALAERQGRERVVDWVRRAIDELRDSFTDSEGSGARPNDPTALVVARVVEFARTTDASRLTRTINATGVVLHTGLGRAPLSEEALRAIGECAAGCDLEIDVETGERRHRGHQLLNSLRRLTGCEDALVVNNNAAATLLALQALCGGREVILSRGQLVEIGGSFRLPEIIALSGATLREVGATNRTRLSDYERAIGPQTAAILRVHPSNYRIVGFTESPDIAELASLAHRAGLVAIDDIGSGAPANVTSFGLPHEPTFAESIAAGADLVLGSGDKLLGGPQAGLLLGRAALIASLKSHPLARAVRVGKLTLSALQATLDLWLRGAAGRDLPVIARLSTPIAALRRRAEALAESLTGTTSLSVAVRDDVAPVGGGSSPGVDLPTVVLAVRHASRSASAFARSLRMGQPRVVPRIHRDETLIDLRSVAPDDDAHVAAALKAACIDP